MAEVVLVAWFYFATVDHIQIWGFGPFSSREECMVHKEMHIPMTVETTQCGMMSIQVEDE